MVLYKVQLKQQWFIDHRNVLHSHINSNSTWKLKKVNDNWYLSTELKSKHSNRPFHIHVSDIERIVGKYDKFLDKLEEL